MTCAQLCGWVNDPEAVQEVLACLPMPSFGDAAPHLAGDAKDCLFWDAEQKVLGTLLRADYQTRGTCVGHGYRRNAQDLILMDIALRGEPEQWLAEVACAPIYAGSRVEIGGGKLRGDGSVGAWAAEWVSTFGVLLRQKYGDIDFTGEDDELAVKLGAPRAGVPDELEPVAKDHPVETISLLESVEEGVAAASNGFPFPICSNQGFETVRDANGFCRPKGRWNHCMASRGYCVVKGNRPAIAIQQSWGDSPTGNNRVTLESGREITLPEGVFLAELDVVDSMIRQGDTFVLSGFRGFPSRDLDFILL